MRFLLSLCFFIFYGFGAIASEGDFVFSDDDLASFGQVTDINPQETLSENLEKIKKSSVNADDTWVDELKKIRPAERKQPNSEETPILSGNDAIKNIVNEKKRQTSSKNRSNAAVFDVSGVMLRMSVLQAESALRKRGYSKISQDLQIPNFIKWRNEEKCRNSGVVGYERLASCVASLSKKIDAQYIERAKYINKKTTEEVEIFMTSNFTGNKLYRIIYTTEIAGIKGSSAKAEYLRNIKVYEFWRKINQKYGRPDDEEAIKWSMGDNAPFLKAQTGFLLLEDPMLLELDWTRMSREDQKYLNTDMYNF